MHTHASTPTGRPRHTTPDEVLGHRTESRVESLAFRAVIAVSAALHLAIAWPLFEGKVYTYDDFSRYHLPMRQFFARCLAAAQDFNWNPDIFCGFYLQGEGQIGLYHPLHWLLYRALPLPMAFMIEVVLPYPLLQFGMYLVLRRWALGKAAAAFGAMLLTFCGAVFLRHVHMNAISTFAHLPWMLWAIDLAMRGGRGTRWAGPLLALITTSELLHGHPQFAYYGLLAQAWYVLVLLAARARGRALGVLVMAKCLGAITALIQILPMYHELGYSVRSEAIQPFGITRPEHLLNLVQWFSPYFFRARVYIPEAAFGLGLYTHEATFYLGAVAPALVIWLSMRRGSWGECRPLVLGAITLAAIGLMLTFLETTPLHESYQRIPVIGLFRVSARYFLLVQVAVACLSAVAFGDLLRFGAANIRAAWPLFLPPVLALLATAFMFARAAAHTPEDARIIASVEMVTLGPTLLLVGSCLVFAVTRREPWAPAALVVFAGLDLGGYGLSFVRNFPVKTLQELVESLPTPPVPGLPGRVMLGGEPFDRATNLLVLGGHRLANGYAALMPRRALNDDSIAALRVSGASWVYDRHASTNPRAHWIPVRGRLARARLVTRAVASDDPAVDLERHNPAEIAIVADALNLPAGRPGSARITRDEPGMIDIATEAETRQLLVLSERFHDGWQVRVDGQPERVVRCYGDFQAVVVEPGQHQVEFRFRPWSLQLGRSLTLAGLGCITLWVAALGMSVRRRTHARPAK